MLGDSNMKDKELDEFTVEDALELLRENVASIVVVDTSTGKYKALIRRKLCENCIDECGEYDDLIHTLWFHMSDSNEEIADEYNAFVSFYGGFKGKYSRKIKVFPGNGMEPGIIQMTVYPIKGTSKIIFVLDELDEESAEEAVTSGKVKTIQNTFLFSMYVDLINDTTSSISVTEISEEVINADIKYSQWRLMTVNMIWPEDREQFLETTDPAYLKENLAPGKTISFDCKMQNLEGEYIWVKLIFSRAKTRNPEDFRFVFMVQDIHEDFKEVMSTLEKYEELAFNDPLTELLNHGSIKSEVGRSIDIHNKERNTVSMMMIDIDYFKKVNDTYGHSVGDKVLKQFASLLRNSMGNNSNAIGRWGGEEFVIVCNGKSGYELKTLADALRESVEKENFPDVGHITCSIGVTQIKDGDSFDDAFNRIDTALYISKDKGRNRVSLA